LNRQPFQIPVARRELLLGLMGLCVGVLAGAAAHSAPLSDWLRAFAPRIFRGLPALHRLGAWYLAAYPQERSRTRLSQLLMPADPGAIHAQLRGAIARDWAGQQVVVVDGWVLARTEARLCALVHLEAGLRS
jgi:hypothetical protein